MAEEVARACDRDLLAHLRATFELAEPEGAAEIPVDAWRPWSGWIVVCLPLGIDVMVSPHLVQEMLGEDGADFALRNGTEAEPVVPLGAALASTAYHLHAELEGCDVGIDVLQDLQPGDVLRLGHPLDAPAFVRGARGEVLFSGFLVRRGARRALELALHPHGGEP